MFAVWYMTVMNHHDMFVMEVPYKILLVTSAMTLPAVSAVFTS